MEAAMKSLPPKGGSNPAVENFRTSRTTGYIDVTYEQPINNTQRFPQQYNQGYQPHHQGAGSRQGYGYTQQGARSNTMSSAAGAKASRRGSVSSTASHSVNNFMKKQWGRFNKNSSNSKVKVADGGYDGDENDDKGVDMDHSDNMDVSFNDLQHIKGDRFGGVGDTTPYIPTILTTGSLNGNTVNNEQYRKLQMANKKKRAIDIAAAQNIDPNNRSMSLSSYGTNQPNYPPRQQSQQQMYTASNGQYSGSQSSAVGRGYGYPHQQMPPGPRAMSLQTRAPMGANPRAMSLQQQQQQQNPYYRNQGPPPRSYQSRPFPPSHPQHQFEFQQNQQNSFPPNQQYQQQYQPQPIQHQISNQQYPVQPPQEQFEQTRSMPPQAQRQNTSYMNQQQHFQHQLQHQQETYQDQHQNPTSISQSHNGGLSDISSSTATKVEQINSRTQENNNLYDTNSSAIKTDEKEFKGKKVHKINFNTYDDEGDDSFASGNTNPIVNQSIEVSPAKRDSTQKKNVSISTVYTRESIVSTSSNLDTEYQNAKEKLMYDQSNATSTTGNTLFYSAMELNNVAENKRNSPIKTSDASETSSCANDTVAAHDIEQNDTLEEIPTPKFAPAAAFTNLDKAIETLPPIKQNDLYEEDFNRYSTEKPLSFPYSVPASENIFEEKTDKPKQSLPFLPSVVNEKGRYEGENSPPQVTIGNESVKMTPSSSKSLTLSSSQPDTSSTPIRKNVEINNSLPLEDHIPQKNFSPFTPISENSVITFTPEQYGKVNDNNVLLRELELVTSELASSVSRELTLEDTIRNRSPAASSIASTDKSAIVDDPDAFLKSAGVEFGSNGDVNVGKEINSTSSSEKGKVILTLANQLAKERKKRYASEEILLQYETHKGLSSAQDDFIKDLKSANQELETENLKLKDALALKDTKKELLEIEHEKVQLHVTDINKKYNQLQNEVIPKLQNRIDMLEDLLLRKTTTSN